MIFWIDEQISPKFADWLGQRFQVVCHSVGLQAIFEKAFPIALDVLQKGEALEIQPTDPAIHQALAKALGDSNPDVRFAVAYALKAIKPSAPHTHELMIQAYKSPTLSVEDETTLATILH